MWSPPVILAHGLSIFLVLTLTVNEGQTSYLHSYLPTRYYAPTRTQTDDNVYITDKYGQVVSVQPYWSRSSKSYNPPSYYPSRCYNCVARTVYESKPYTRKVYVKDRFGNSFLVNPYYYRREYLPSSRSGRYYSDGRSVSSHEDYVYINDMYGRTRAVPKSSYLYEYAKGY